MIITKIFGFGINRFKLSNEIFEYNIFQFELTMKPFEISIKIKEIIHLYVTFKCVKTDLRFNNFYCYALISLSGTLPKIFSFCGH